METLSSKNGDGMSNFLKNLLSAIISTLVLVGIFCLGFLGEPENNPQLNESNLWGPGDPFYGFEMFLADPLLIWRQRPGFDDFYIYEFAKLNVPVKLNSLGLHDDEILPVKKAGFVRIMNIGDSATWGLNLTRRADTYSDQLEDLLNRRGGPGPEYDVINAGIIGYSSLQGAEFLRLHLPELEPDVVTVYFGNNDSSVSPPDSHDYTRIPKLARSPFRFLYRNWFFLKSRHAYHSLNKTKYMEARQDLVKPEWLFSTSKEEFYRSRVRVTPADYEKNLRDIVTTSRKMGVRVVLLKVPQNLLWPPRIRPKSGMSVKHLYRNQGKHWKTWWSAVVIEEGYLDPQRNASACREMQPMANHPYLCIRSIEDFTRRGAFAVKSGYPNVEALLRKELANPALSAQGRLRALHNLGVWAIVHGKFEEAQMYLGSVITEANRPGVTPSPFGLLWAHYHLGIARFLQGDDTAWSTLRKSREFWPFAMSPDYDRRFDRVVRDLQVEWIDLPKIFSEADPQFRGSALMHDWVHSNRTGNRLIAEAIATRVK